MLVGADNGEVDVWVVMEVSRTTSFENLGRLVVKSPGRFRVGGRVTEDYLRLK